MTLNPLLARTKLPGRVFQLPSKGLFYQPGVLSPEVKDGEVQVKPMSALTEIKIRSADLLYSTKILQEICAECVPEVLQPAQLLSKDVDAIFTFLIASTYGAFKSIRATHDCEKADWHDYEVNVDKIIENPNNRVLDHAEVIFKVELPLGFTVRLKPVTFGDSIELMQLRVDLSRKEVNSDKIETSDLEKILITDMMSSIAAVEVGEGADRQVVTNPGQIIEWIRQLPKTQIDAIIAAATQAADWGFNFNTKLKCKDCGAVFDYDLELNPISFFTG